MGSLEPLTARRPHREKAWEVQWGPTIQGSMSKMKKQLGECSDIFSTTDVWQFIIWNKKYTYWTNAFSSCWAQIVIMRTISQRRFAKRPLHARASTVSNETRNWTHGTAYFPFTDQIPISDLQLIALEKRVATNDTGGTIVQWATSQPQQHLYLRRRKQRTRQMSLGRM